LTEDLDRIGSDLSEEHLLVRALGIVDLLLVFRQAPQKPYCLVLDLLCVAVSEEQNGVARIVLILGSGVGRLVVNEELRWAVTFQELAEDVPVALLR